MNTLPADAEEKDSTRDFLKITKDIFVKVGKWGAFEEDDIRLDYIWNAFSPSFFSEFERELDRKP